MVVAASESPPPPPHNKRQKYLCLLAHLVHALLLVVLVVVVMMAMSCLCVWSCLAWLLVFLWLLHAACLLCCCLSLLLERSEEAASSLTSVSLQQVLWVLRTNNDHRAPPPGHCWNILEPCPACLPAPEGKLGKSCPPCFIKNVPSQEKCKATAVEEHVEV